MKIALLAIAWMAPATTVLAQERSVQAECSRQTNQFTYMADRSLDRIGGVYYSSPIGNNVATYRIKDDFIWVSVQNASNSYGETQITKLMNIAYEQGRQLNLCVNRGTGAIQAVEFAGSPPVPPPV